VEQDQATRTWLKARSLVAIETMPAWRRLRWLLGARAAALRDVLDEELAERVGFQWLAVWFAAGALIYFSLPREPLLTALVAATMCCGLAAALARRRGAAARVLVGLTICLAGMGAAKVRVDSLMEPAFGENFSAEMSGRVIAVESRAERRPRVTLDTLESADVSSLPQRIRVTFAGRYGLPPIGAKMRFQASLAPIPEPVVPGGYDPHRAAFFERIGAGGYLLGGWELAEPPPRLSPDLAVAHVRAAMVERILAAEPGEAGAVAAALLVGERSSLSEETNESLRRSGLAHILSISGLHMMLIAGAAFFAVRAALALSPRLALAYPIRKWAAAIALAVVTLYLILSGGAVATVRAYVMAAIMFAAILVDRPAISMRNLAIAAFVVLAMEPESVMEPGFQMSFAAVAALVAAWEAWARRRRLRISDPANSPALRVVRWGSRAIIGIAATTLVAGLATAPFAAYHFERVAPYSLLGNLLAAPLVSAIIMPAGLLTLVAMPFGLEALPLWAMAIGIKGLLAVSDWVARLPGADMGAPPFPAVSLLLASLGLLWLCLWQRRWRALGIPAIGVGILVAPILSRPADILIAPDGAAVAVRDQAGILRVSGSRSGSYVIEQLYDEEPGPPLEKTALREGVRCDDLGCILRAEGGIIVAHVLDAPAFAEDCRRADIVVTPLAAPPNCAAALVIDAARLSRFGAHALRLRDGGPLVSVERAVARPWQTGWNAVE
jgi:competence protein ComEC